jgi:Ankyrin repeats (many copies)
MSQQQVLVPIMTPLAPRQINQHSHESNHLVARSTAECKGNGRSPTTPAALVCSLLFSGKKRSLPGTAEACRRQTAMSTADEDRVAAYDHDVARAIRSNDLDQLRDLFDDGRCFSGCNRNGETLLHLACRRSDWEVVDFLISEAGVSTDCRDTLGRSCLHDCAWRPVPSWPMMDLLLRHLSPWLLVEADCRGHTCLDYVRPCDYAIWNAYLVKSSAVIQRRAKLAALFQSFG